MLHCKSYLFIQYYWEIKINECAINTSECYIRRTFLIIIIFMLHKHTYISIIFTKWHGTNQSLYSHTHTKPSYYTPFTFETCFHQDVTYDAYFLSIIVLYECCVHMTTIVLHSCALLLLISLWTV
jgi:hypothetical protein